MAAPTIRVAAKGKPAKPAVKPAAKPVAPAPAPAKSVPATPAKPVKVKGKGVTKPPSAPPPAPPDKAQKTAAGFAKPEMMMPTSQTAVVNNLISRELQSPSGPLEPISDTVSTLVLLTKSISAGEDISSIRTKIVQIASHQPEKAEVFQSVLNLINQERVADAVVMRAQVEKVLKRSVNRGDLNTSECLAVWEITNGIIKDHEAKAAKQNKAVDTVTTVEKVDVQSVESERIIHEKWEQTTPQGRQIIRMKLFDLKRSIVAKSTTTTSVESSEEDTEEKEPTPASKQ